MFGNTRIRCVRGDGVAVHYTEEKAVSPGGHRKRPWLSETRASKNQCATRDATKLHAQPKHIRDP